MDIHYESKVKEGDPYYVEFWDRVQNNPEESTFSTIKEGLQHLRQDRYVIHTVASILRGFFKGNTLPNQEIKVIYKDRPTFGCVLATKNSPLVPTLRMGVDRMRQLGLLQKLTDKWQGKLPSNAGQGSETQVLSLGHLVSAFSMMGLVVFICTLVLAAEKLCRQMKEVSIF